MIDWIHSMEDHFPHHHHQARGSVSWLLQGLFPSHTHTPTHPHLFPPEALEQLWGQSVTSSVTWWWWGGQGPPGSGKARGGSSQGACSLPSPPPASPREGEPSQLHLGLFAGQGWALFGNSGSSCSLVKENSSCVRVGGCARARWKGGVSGCGMSKPK